MRLRQHNRLNALDELCQFRFGVYQVDSSQETVGVQYLLDVRAHLVREDGEDADHLAALLGLQLTHAVVGLHHLGRLNEDGLSCGTLIVHNTVYLPLQSWCHRNHQSSVAQRGCRILVNQSVALCRVQYSI